MTDPLPLTSRLGSSLYSVNMRGMNEKLSSQGVWIHWSTLPFDMTNIYEQFLNDSNHPKYVKAVKCQFHQSMLFVVSVVCPKIGSEWIGHAKRKVLLPLHVLKINPHHHGGK